MVYYSLKDAASETGLSVDFLRKGCRSGRVPHIMSGAKYLVNVPRLLEILETEGNKDDAK